MVSTAIDSKLDSKVPAGDISTKWANYKDNAKLIAPHNKRKYEVIVVGTGLAGASAAASLAELGYKVKAFTFHDSPRRAHSIAAQGGINAAKNYRNDGDSIHRLFYDTVKGGDFRAREANVHRLAENSVHIIDQCVAQGVPFAREYGGTLATRSFGGAQLMRTFYARGQTGQQLLLGAYSALERQVALGNVEMITKTEMLDLIVVDGKAKGIVARDLVTGKIDSHFGHAVLLCTGGYGNVYYLSTNAKNSNTTAIWRAYKRGAQFGNPCFVQVHPTCIPVSGDYQSKLTLMSESLRNDGRVWVPKNADDKRPPAQIPESDRDYYLESKYPAFGNLVPRDVASRNAKEQCDLGKGVGQTGLAVYLDFSDSIKRLGQKAIEGRYGNLFDMYRKITDDNPYETPMRIYPAVHYTMGGLWVDYNLMTTIPGVFALGEANFSDHGANRLGASALMQGLSDGYFVIPYTVASYLAGETFDRMPTDSPAFKAVEQESADRLNKLLSIQGTHSPDDLHRHIGKLMWDYCGITRTAEGLAKAKAEVVKIREQVWNDLKVSGTADSLNQSLEKANRLADYVELAELMIDDATAREESCGCHLREEYQTPEGEALRNDDKFAHVAAWEYKGENAPAQRNVEPLTFENVKLVQRSYK
jgi:succinate dehydrogenase / fumarate reductase, flavoprotein subunit